MEFSAHWRYTAALAAAEADEVKGRVFEGCRVSELDDERSDGTPSAVTNGAPMDSSKLAQAQARLHATGSTLPVWRRNRFVQGVRQHWDAFYTRHQAHFFKDRHYLEVEYPQFMDAATKPVHVLEFGCGVGNAFLPLCERLPHLSVTAFDLSRRAISLIHSHPLYATGRIVAFEHNAIAPAVMAADASSDGSWINVHEHAGYTMSAAWEHLQAAATSMPARLFNTSPLAERGFDLVLCMFMVSALPHAMHAHIFEQAAACLRPGGFLLFRDYCVFDEAELRFKPGKRLDTHLFAREDGTLAAFMSEAELEGLAAGAGLVTRELRHVYRRITNRQLGHTMDRIWLHGIFQKPAFPLLV